MRITCVFNANLKRTNRQAEVYMHVSVFVLSVILAMLCTVYGAGRTFCAYLIILIKASKAQIICVDSWSPTHNLFTPTHVKDLKHEMEWTVVSTELSQHIIRGTDCICGQQRSMLRRAVSILTYKRCDN